MFVAFVSLSPLIWHPNLIQLLNKPKKHEKFAHFMKISNGPSGKGVQKCVRCVCFAEPLNLISNIIKLLKKSKKHEKLLACLYQSLRSEHSSYACAGRLNYQKASASAVPNLASQIWPAKLDGFLNWGTSGFFSFRQRDLSTYLAPYTNSYK